MKKIIIFVAAFLLTAALVLIFLLLVYPKMIDQTPNVIAISKSFREKIDPLNTALANCSQDKLRESIANDSTLSLADAQKRLIDSVNNESDCFQRNYTEVAVADELVMTRMINVDCAHVQNPDKCQFIKENAKALRDNAQDTISAANKFYEELKQWIYCIIKDPTTAASCTSADSTQVGKLAKDNEATMSTFRENTKYYANL